MFSFSLHASLTTLVASAVAISAAPSLSVKTSTPSINVDGLENLKVTTTVVNTGDETLKLLNDPRGVLDPFPENAFIITNPTGSRPLFNGAMVNYDPTYAAGLDSPSIFTVLVAGASINVIHDLSAAYNFTRSGAGNYSIEPSSLFTYIDVDGTPKDLYATVEGIAEVTLSGNLAVSRVHNKRATTEHCSSGQKLDIFVATMEAQVLVSNAYAYLDGIDDENPPRRYITWFGRYTFLQKIVVQETFKQMKDHPFSSYTYDCSCDLPGSHAFVYLEIPGRIHLCPSFWNLPTTGTRTKAGTLIHEASHDVANTVDYVRGVSDCMALAKIDSWKCASNADSYEFFVEQGVFTEPALEHDELRSL